MPRLLPPIALAMVAGCAAPAVTRDGQLVFTEGGQRGATVLTANGVEFVDRTHMPAPVVRRSAFEAWRPPTGFLLPADGVLRDTSYPVAIEGRGLAVVLRASDRIVPSWGGELLVRLDALVPVRAFDAAAESVRPPLELVVVLDADGFGAQPLVEAAFDALGQRDRVALVDSARGGRIVVPSVPGTHRTLLEGAAERLLEQRSRGPRPRRDLGAALALGLRLTADATPDGVRREPQLLLISDGVGVSDDRGRAAREARALASAGVRLTVIAANERVEPETLDVLGTDVHTSRDPDELERAVATAIEPPGDVVLRDLVLSFSSAPAPARVVEASAGELSMTLEDDQLDLGDLYVGEARTEVVRIAVPQWTPGERYELTVTASYRDARSGARLAARRRLRLLYSQDIAQLADHRHGDVIAYASGLAMVKRLERAFLGAQIERAGGMSKLLRWQADSLGRLSAKTGDRSLAQQAEVLDALLDASID